MNIVVCVKRVPSTQEVDLEINSAGNDIKRDMLTYSINEWDNYAAEEAIQLRERTGGKVTVITIGNEDDEEILRRSLAMGADNAIRIDPGDKNLDPFLVSKILAKAVQDLEYDLIFTGVQSDDTNNGITGILLAGQLDLAHSSVVNGIEYQDKEIKVSVELEGGMEEVTAIDLPALLTIQTGINEPRYVSIMGIRKAAKKELKILSLNDLGFSDDELEAKTKIEEIFLPPETEGAEMIEGDPSHAAEELIRIIKEKGVNI